MQPELEPARLIVTAEGRDALLVEVGEQLTIGRSTSNALVVEDHKASRVHAELRHLGGGRYRLSDLGSANGTWLNGRRLTAPKDLHNGDQIQIGSVEMRFIAALDPELSQSASARSGTALDIRHELVVVLVSDVRNYTTMSEALPGHEFSQLMNQWFREVTGVIDAFGGTVDKFIGDAVMAYWVCSSKSNPTHEVGAALNTACEFIRRAAVFSRRVSSRFPGHSFAIGVGINMGDAMLCNIGTSVHQSFTVVGDTVNIAFRLEPLTKSKGFPVILGKDLASWASGGYQFQDLGEVEVKGRRQPIPILGLNVTPALDS